MHDAVNNDIWVFWALGSWWLVCFIWGYATSNKRHMKWVLRQLEKNKELVDARCGLPPPGKYPPMPPVKKRVPVAWIRRHPDGSLTKEVLADTDVRMTDVRMTDVRRESGAWVPLFKI